MSYTAKEPAAIERFCVEENATPELSVYPMTRFKLRSTGAEVVHHVQNLVSKYKEVDAQNRRAKKRSGRDRS